MFLLFIIVFLGIHLADASLWLACVSVLAAFDIRPIVKDGRPVLASGKYMDGSIRCVIESSTLLVPRKYIDLVLWIIF